MKKHIFWFILLTYISITAQEAKEIAIVLNASINNIQNSSFYVYEPPFKAKAIYNDITQAVNKYPEQLMSSVMSENSEAWHNYNKLKKGDISDGKKERFKNVKFLNKDTNYFELLHKLEFNLYGNKYAIIKFNLVLDENKKSVKGAFTLVNIDGSWKKTSLSFRLTMLNVIFKTSKLQEVFKGVPVGNILMDELINEIYTDEILNMKKLLKEFESWSINNETEKLEYFTENPNWNK